MDVNPPEARIGFGDLIGRAEPDLMTMGSGLFEEGCDWLPLLSKRLTSEVVGGMGVSSVGWSSSSAVVLVYFSDSLLGFGGAAGLRVCGGIADTFFALPS